MSPLLEMIARYDNDREALIDEQAAEIKRLRKEVADAQSQMMSASMMTDKYKLDAIMAGAYDKLRAPNPETQETVEVADGQ